VITGARIARFRDRLSDPNQRAFASFHPGTD
jgi:hypothetical protein